ncbi:MAG: DUF2796 domain-containing protein [Bdellovibrionota bacterium]
MVSKICPFLFFSVFCYSTICFAHDAHEHGTAKVDIAFERSGVVNLNFEAPAISIYGFEHEAKTAEQKSVVEKSMKKLKDNIFNMVVFAKTLNCKLTKNKIAPFVKEEDPEPEEILAGSEHGDVKASFTFQCNKTLDKSLIHFSFSEYFPDIHELKVQVLGDKVQKGITIKNKKGDLQL